MAQLARVPCPFRAGRAEPCYAFCMTLRFSAAAALACLFLAVAPGQAQVSVSRSVLDQAPAVLKIDDNEVVGRASIWVNRMPKVVAPGTIMRKPGYSIRIELQPAQPSQQPSVTVALRPDRVWLINEKNVWEGNFAGATREGPRIFVLRNGPVWPVGIVVDCVVRLLDQRGQAYYLKIVAVPVEAVY